MVLNQSRKRGLINLIVERFIQNLQVSELLLPPTMQPDALNTSSHDRVRPVQRIFCMAALSEGGALPVAAVNAHAAPGERQVVAL